MHRLWAPWRMEYIAGEQRPGCLFCRVIEHPDDPDAGLVVWRPQGAIVMLNKFPYNPGHAMVAPIAHKASLEDLDDAETTELMRAVRRTIGVLNKTMTPDGLNAGVNIGRASGPARDATVRAVSTPSRPRSRPAGPPSPPANRTQRRGERRLLRAPATRTPAW